MAKQEWYDVVMVVLVLIGAINWGLVGLFSFNLVETIFGVGMFTKIVYVLVGVSGVVGTWRLFRK